MKKIKTGDNSETIFSEEYGEHFHSVTGAYEESVKKYIEPCKISDGMKILDIGFGLGYNIAAAITAAKNLKIISLEKDKKVLDYVQEISADDSLKESYETVKKAARDLFCKDKSRNEIRIILGDARETIKQIDEKFDAVFLDPFSPKKNPELWTAEFFSEIHKRMRKGAILATYSCAGLVRRNLKQAGFEIRDGPCVGRRSPSTVAIA
jgi:chorismate dehydratase